MDSAFEKARFNLALRFLSSTLSSQVSESELLKNAHAILKAPRISTLRINTLKTDTESARLKVEELIRLQDSRFSLSLNSKVPNVLFVEALGPFEVTPKPRKLIVSPECSQAVLRGSHVFAPGVLALEDDCLHSQDVSVWGDLEGKCTRGLRTPYRSDRMLFLGNGQLIQPRHLLFRSDGEKASGVAVIMSEMEWKMPSFDEFPRSWLFPQNFPSILAVEELEVSPGMNVLDMCASPGGKTSHIAACMANFGRLVAIDKNVSKVKKLQRTLSDLGVTCADTFVADSTNLDRLVELTGLRTFDRILVDPPCSAMGQRPWLAGKTDELALNTNTNVNFADYQQRLLSVAYKLLKPGGLLVYSTCTLSVEENEMNINYAIQHYGAELIPPKFDFGDRGISAVNEIIDSSLVRRFWPAGPDDSVGFFYAKLKKPEKEQ